MDDQQVAARSQHQYDTGLASDLASRLNWLRAGALGANDGIISTAGLVVGVAGAQASRSAVLIAGIAGLVAGALSMAGGEYMSVSTQKDTELAVLEKERWELANMPHEELNELAGLYRTKGLSPDLAHQVAVELTRHDALGAHAETELGISSEEQSNPTHAALASMLAFALGAALPLLAMVLSPTAWRMAVTWVAVLVSLAATGVITSRLGGARPIRPVARNLIIGVLTMGLTWLIGHFVGVGLG
ncbi:VIT family protein [Naumannella sp. ID2617S]|nr:VIT family protein [Naumannella sp. ID2617S]